LVSKVYWLAPETYRSETKGTGADMLTVAVAGKPGIMLNHAGKYFVRTPPVRKYTSPLAMFKDLGKLSGKADRDLGSRDIGGIRAEGFEIAARKIDPDALPGPIQIWVDPKSHLPVLIRYEKNRVDSPGEIRMEDFRWNVVLDSKLFEPPEPPAGYTDLTRNAPSPAEIATAFRTYAGLSGGRYPQAGIINAEVVYDEMLKAIGIKGPITGEQRRGEHYQSVFEALGTFSRVTDILANNPDAAYYGNTVGPNDKDKVLLRWKLDDGKYQVLFGDLRAASVTPEELQALERKSR
jgi:hypothetical protein